MRELPTSMSLGLMNRATQAMEAHLLIRQMSSDLQRLRSGRSTIAEVLRITAHAVLVGFCDRLMGARLFPACYAWPLRQTISLVVGTSLPAPASESQ